MAIIFHEDSGEFHIYNKEVSYIIKILDNKQLGNLYYGKKVHDKKSFDYLLEGKLRPLAAYVFEENYSFSLQYIKQEYPSYGTTDFRYGAIEIKQENGSKITNFEYKSHKIFRGKKQLDGLPSTYVEDDREAESLEIILYDSLIDIELILSYTVYDDLPVITRNAKVINKSKNSIVINKAMSVCVDLPDCNFEMVHLAGAWSRERYIKCKRLDQGIQGIYSMTGTSSSEHNPFIALKRQNADEFNGEVYGFSLIYSGNHLEQVEVDNHDMTRVLIGIHPDTFEWKLDQGEAFQTPEVVMVYSDGGINKMSQAYHKLYRTRLVRGKWRDRVRPVVINNWEATGMEFNEEKILSIARTGKQLGMELFVLDDGWFGSRDNDKAGLGDWYVTNYNKLPEGIIGLANKIEAMGMKFGLWFEPEMVNKDSDLYRAHPDWILATPGRRKSHCRNQYVLDFSRNEVLEYIFNLMEKVLSEAKISYVKWDMNRYITECYSIGKSTDAQGKVFHQYVLGVYNLYERLISKFPDILFESCSSGGARFDPGMLYYAPQTWTSDDSDAIERLKIQYGTSLVYPIISMGAHVSAVPNQQVGRITPIETRANVAYFGAFGYELDLNNLSDDEKKKVRKQVEYYKAHRQLIMNGIFYRISSPFKGNITSWIVVSEDKREAIAAYYKVLNDTNKGYKRFRLKGLDINKKYIINDNENEVYYGDELMNVGIVIDEENFCAKGMDFSSMIYYLREYSKR